MAEPTSTAATTAAVVILPAGVVNLGVALFGPNSGEWAAIVFCAFAGALWAVKDAPTATRAEAAMLVLRLMLTALVLTSPLAWWLERTYHVPPQWAVAVGAFAIAMFGNKWADIPSKLAEWASKRFGGGV